VEGRRGRMNSSDVGLAVGEVASGGDAVPRGLEILGRNRWDGIGDSLRIVGCRGTSHTQNPQTVTGFTVTGFTSDIRLPIAVRMTGETTLLKSGCMILLDRNVVIYHDI
jgi:hypothetical protein